MKAAAVLITAILAAPLGGADFGHTTSVEMHSRSAAPPKSHPSGTPESTPSLVVSEPPSLDGALTALAYAAAPLGEHKSIIQFLVGRDGRAESFIVEKAAGYGFDEACKEGAERSTWLPATWHGVTSPDHWRRTCTFNKE